LIQLAKCEIIYSAKQSFARYLHFVTRWYRRIETSVASSKPFPIQVCDNGANWHTIEIGFRRQFQNGIKGYGSNATIRFAFVAPQQE
jgi:hypothetical protein